VIRRLTAPASVRKKLWVTGSFSELLAGLRHSRLCHFSPLHHFTGTPGGRHPVIRHYSSHHLLLKAMSTLSQPPSAPEAGSEETSLHFASINPSGKRTIVLIHGACCAGSNWDLVIPYLANSYHPLIPDLPGHGQSRHITPFLLNHPQNISSDSSVSTLQMVEHTLWATASALTSPSILHQPIPRS
jgi:pimeloyl-ACP methyl ester carboxylesterase